MRCLNNVESLHFILFIVLTDAPAAKRCKMDSSPQSSSSPSVKHETQSASVSSQQSVAYMNSMSTASGSGTQMNLQLSGGPPNVVIPPQHTSNPPSVGSTASQSATPIQPHPPAAAIHTLPNQLVQQNFSPQANSNTSSAAGAAVTAQQVYAPSYSSTVQQQVNVTASSYTQEMQQSSQPHSHMEAAGSSSLPATTSGINFDSAGVSKKILYSCLLYYFASYGRLHSGVILQALDLGLDQFPDPADLLDCFDTDAIPTNDDDILTMLRS